MKSPSGTSSKKKRAALNVKKAVKTKTTRNSRKPSAKATARAMTRTQSKLPASRASEPSSRGLRDNAAAEPKLSWIIISNVHQKVAYEDIVRPLFEIAGRVSSHEALNNQDGVFQGTVELVYERSEDAIAAVKLFDDTITFFGKTWLVMCEDAYFGDGDDDDDEDGDDEEDSDNDDDDSGPTVVTRLSSAIRKLNCHSR